MQRGTLVWRIGAAIIGLELVFAVLLSWYVQRELRDYHLARTEEQLHRFAILISERLESESLAPGDDSLQQIVQRLGRDAHLRITLVLPDGRVLAESDAEPAGMDNHRLRPEVDSALSGGAGVAIRYSATVQSDLMYVALATPIDTAPTEVVIRVAFPLTEIYKQLRAVIQTLGVAFGLFILATTGVVWFMSVRTSAAVRRIADGAHRFAMGDLTHRIPRTSSEELTSLAVALNEMAELLSKRMKELQSQQAETTAVLDSMTGGIIALGLDHRVLSINGRAAQMLSIDPHKARGRLLQEVVRQPALNEFVSEAIADPEGQQDEFDLAAEPSIRVAAASGPLRAADGALRGAVIALDDVTQLRRLESIRTDFAANVSHELRTPITNIKGYVETLEETGFDDQGQARRFLSVIARNAERLGAIVTDMLMLTRLERQDYTEGLDAQPSSVFSIVMNAVGHLTGEATEKQIRFECNIDERLRLPLNAALIEQALTNLLQNAIRYSPSGSQVCVYLEQAELANPGDAIAICIEDQGPGISHDHLPRLFERFYRVDKARSREQGGTGLGLAIVKHIALAHGGRIDVTSEMGSGSVFRLVLPKATT